MQPIGRLAPSPTGHLHLGNAWAFLWAWAACRKQNSRNENPPKATGRLLLRMEDIDPERSTPAFAAALMDDLRWLGLDWDAEPLIQSQRSAFYDAALDSLAQQNRLYPCYCTRKELREQLASLAGAPHVDDRGAPYPGTCQHLSPEQRQVKEAAGRRACLRLRTADLPSVDFTDIVCGPQRMTLEACGGDFALRRSDGVYAYQLAVVVDDALSGVNQVVRGNDILVSTPRQIALCRLLGYPQPTYAHLPLLCDENGERLAKRHASLSLCSLRDAGVAPERIIGLLAHKAGFIPTPTPCSPAAVLPAFHLSRFTPEAVRLSPSDLHFLYKKTG